MKHSARIYKIIGIVLVIFLFIPQAVFAEDVTVSNNGDNSANNITVTPQSSGPSTACDNENCPTQANEGTPPVCSNSPCPTPESGNEGQIHSTPGENEITPEPTANATTIPATSEPTMTETPTMTPDPTIMQMRQDINNQVKKDAEAVQEQVKEQNAVIAAFIKSEMNALQTFLNNLFK